MYEFLYYRVRDAMTAQPVVIDPHAPLSEVERLFETHDFNGLPIVDRSGRLVGMMTKLDLLRAFAFTPESIIPPYETIMCQPAERFMNADPETVGPDLPLTRVLQEMIDTRFKSFPVVEEGRLLGIIAREDIMQALRLAVAGEKPPGSS